MLVFAMTVWSVLWQLSFAGGAAYVEPRYLEDKRPDIHAFFPDDRVMLDVCVSHPSSPSRLSLAPGYALRYRENAKIAGYSSLAKDSGCRFVPFAFESFGSLGPAGVAFLRDLESYAKESFLPFIIIVVFLRWQCFCRRGMPRCLRRVLSW